MTHRMRGRALFAGAALGTLWAALAPEATAATAAAGDAALNGAEGGQIQEVIVTAQRRETSLIKTPVAVSSIGSAAITSRHLLDVQDLTSQAPGVQFGSNHTNADITIRGIGNSTSTQGTDPGVSFHLDGVYLGRSNLAAATLLDVDHVEILRGPQGTLFGRNATGGVVNVISKAPTRDFQAELGGWVGAGPTQVHADGYVSGPLNGDGTLLGRFSARRDYNEGFTPNLAAGGPARLDDQDGYSLRGQIQARPTDQLTLGLAVDYAHEADHGRAIFILGAPGVTPTGGYATITPSELAAQDAAQDGVAGAIPGDIARRQAEANQGSFKASFVGVRATLDWRAPHGTLKGLAAYGWTRADSDEDGDGTDLNYSNTIYNERAHQTYAELIYAADRIGPVDWLAGADVYNQHADERIEVPVSYFNASVIIPSTLDTLSWAVFGHGEYHLTDRASLFAGVRYTHDRKSIDEANNFAGQQTHAAAWSSVTYEVGGSLQLATHVNAYAKYATGFKSGGFQAGDLAPPFRPETNGSVEVGLKGLFLDQRLQVDVTAFHMDYDNLQVNQIIGFASVVTNAAQARINGVEADVVALVTPGLRAELTASYLHARFTRFLSQDSARPSLGTLDLSGNVLPNAPSFSYSLGLYYDLPLAAPGKLTLGVRYYWKDKVWFSEFNLPVAAQAAVGRGDVSLTWQSPDRRWEAGVFARNIADARVVSSAQVVSAVLNSASIASLDPGRQVGISLRRRF